MILAIFNIKPANNTAPNIAKIWINTDDINSAQTTALEKLIQEEIEVISIIEIIETNKSDYFPPCTSLDTFICAEREGVAVLYS